MKRKVGILLEEEVFKLAKHRALEEGKPSATFFRNRSFIISEITSLIAAKRGRPTISFANGRCASANNRSKKSLKRTARTDEIQKAGVRIQETKGESENRQRLSRN